MSSGKPLRHNDYLDHMLTQLKRPGSNISSLPPNHPNINTTNPINRGV